MMAGRSTLWPRLDTGNSSVTPWMTPTTPASRYVMCAGQPWPLAAARVAPDWSRYRSVMPALSPWCSALLARHRGGVVPGPPGDLRAEPDQRVVLAADHALFQRGER